MMIPRSRELVSFLGVGGAGFVTDVTAFNLLRSLGSTVDRPLLARALAMALAMIVTYTGSRAVTWRGRTTGDRRREVRLFVLFNLIGFAFSAACLAFSRHVLGLNSAWADNISANLVGVGLGTVFRFVTYRRFVFPPSPGPRTDQDDDKSFALSLLACSPPSEVDGVVRREVSAPRRSPLSKQPETSRHRDAQE